MSGRGLAPYDGVLVVSFGGPEGPEDVLPFLANVTRGVPIPPHRLEEVAGHYRRFGGVSPITDQARRLVAALGRELRRRDVDVPVVLGTRNWRPTLDQALATLLDAGARRLLMLPTAAYASYSGCRQYREDVAAARARLGARARGVTVDKPRVFYDSPGFLEANVQAVVASLGELLAAGVDPSDVLLAPVTHSIPVSMDRASGEPGVASTRYSAQHRHVVRALVPEVERRLGLPAGTVRHQLVFCSRSGSPREAWLEPDVNDALESAHADGMGAVCCAPIGFLSDHMEVVHYLDVEARATAERAGLRFTRAATAGTHPELVSSLVDLLEERAALARGEDVAWASAPATRVPEAPGPWHWECPPDGCLRVEGSPTGVAAVAEGRLRPAPGAAATPQRRMT